MRCVRCLVRGHVQGVFFRAATRRQAQALGLTGHAVNLPDGRVEVIICGERTARERLCVWLWEGPAQARVEDVDCTTMAILPPADFRTA